MGRQGSLGKGPPLTASAAGSPRPAKRWVAAGHGSATAARRGTRGSKSIPGNRLQRHAGGRAARARPAALPPAVGLRGAPTGPDDLPRQDTARLGFPGALRAKRDPVRQRSIPRKAAIQFGLRHSSSPGVHPKRPHSEVVSTVGRFPISRPLPIHRKGVSTVLTRNPLGPVIPLDMPQVLRSVAIIRGMGDNARSLERGAGIDNIQ